MKTKNFFPAQKYSAALALSIFVMLSYASCSTTQNGVSNEAIQERFIFELSENVTRTSVTFTNRFGITLSGDLYTARDLDTATAVLHLPIWLIIMGDKADKFFPALEQKPTEYKT